MSAAISAISTVFSSVGSDGIQLFSWIGDLSVLKPLIVIVFALYALLYSVRIFKSFVFTHSENGGR